MQWHNHVPFWKAVARAMGLPIKPEVIAALEKHVYDPHDITTWNTRAQLAAERVWLEDRSPYYDIYPSVVEAFTKVGLTKVDCSMLKLPLRALLVRFPVGGELVGPKHRANTAFVFEHVTQDERRAWLVAINTACEYEIDGNMIPIHTVVGCHMNVGSTVMDHLREGRTNPYAPEDEPTCDNDLTDQVFKLIATLCLLKDNPDLVDPLPLEADRLRWEETRDMELIKKAERRGKRGWAIGSHIDIAPGFRRPHFAIRWCGVGRTDPRLRPIKGCLVRKKKVVTIPTGRLGLDNIR